MTPQSPASAVILLVDDSPNDIELTLHALRSRRLANIIEVVRDGGEALARLFDGGSGEPPDLILLDLKLPKVDGIEVLRRLKADERLRAIPVIVLTSSRQEQDLLAAYRHHVNSYIQKPVDFDEFERVVETLGMYWLSTNVAPQS